MPHPGRAARFALACRLARPRLALACRLARPRLALACRLARPRLALARRLARPRLALALALDALGAYGVVSCQSTSTITLPGGVCSSLISLSIASPMPSADG